VIRTRKGKLLIACGVVVFLLVSGLLARWLSLENIERDDIVTLLQAEARATPTRCWRSCTGAIATVARTCSATPAG